MSYTVRIPVRFDTHNSNAKQSSAIKRWLRQRKLWIKRDHPNFPDEGTDDKWVKIGFDWIELKNPALSARRRGRRLYVHPGDAMVYTFGRQDDAALFKLFFG